jgi:deazaflavin-dependent oxidoreductase (nitroreductase family)
MPLSGEYAPSPSDRARKQAERYEATDGGDANTMLGRPVVVLTSIGARSGLLRKTPLMRVEHDGDYVVVGSLGGSPKHPVWVFNLRQNPRVELQDGAEKHDYEARELEGGERETWWRRAVEAFPNYAVYQEKTDRLIPLFLLTRVDR